MFYVSICTVCNCGLSGDRYARDHSNSQCREFMRLREHYNVPMTMRIDQEDFSLALVVEKELGHLPKPKKKLNSTHKRKIYEQD
jgi:hypothetical protein